MEHFAYDFDPTRRNVFENNCYYNAMSPLVDVFSMNLYPGFTSQKYSDINSLTLSKDSPLIGAGVKIDDGITTDFFGNEITSTNIGCYGGTGTDTPYKHEDFQTKMIRHLIDIISTLLQEIIGMFD